MKKINKYNLKGELVEIYSQSQLFSQNLNYDSIIRCCEGKYQTSGGYIWRFEGDDFNKHFKKKGEVKCKICGMYQTVRGMAMHLKHSHNNLKTVDYVKKYGEFRPKQLKKIKLKNKSNIKCKECGAKMTSHQHLIHHLNKHKNITWEEYFIKHFFNGKHPTCKCGCGEEVTLLRHGEKNPKGELRFHREYVKGHWDWIKPGYNTHSDITKDLMRELAIKRTQSEVEIQGYANIHSPEVLQKRRIDRKDKALERFHKSHPDVEILNVDDIDRVSLHNNFEYKCLKCGNEWVQKSLTPRCLKCYPYEFNNVSKEEEEIVEFIKQHYPEEDLILNCRNQIPPYEIDIFFPKLNLGIEYHGLYWHSEIHKSKNYHYDKFNLSKENGIKLIQIFSDEWVNNPKIVKSRILNLINKTPNRIYARKCEIKEIKDPKVKNKFLNENHLQGEDRSRIKLGLYYEGELVSLMTFGSPRKAIGMKGPIQEGQWELIRFCNKINTSVIGGASKLFKHFIRNYNPKQIYSFADNRWSTPKNNLYTSLNFTLKNQSKPGYWYTKNFTERIHRYNFNKSKLKELGFDVENLTEHNIMNSIKYYKVWDAGVSRYEFDL